VFFSLRGAQLRFRLKLVKNFHPDMDQNETPINGRPERAPGILDAVRWPFEVILWTIQRHLIWPLQDHASLLSGPGRALAGLAVLLVAVAAVLGGAALAGSGGSDASVAPTTVAVASSPPAGAPAPAADTSPAPTLQGAAPVFTPAGRDNGSEAKAAKPIESSPPPSTSASSSSSASASSSAATGTISSVPSSSSAAEAGTSSSGAPVDGRPAGPAAVAVAKEFAGAFVLYETGGEKTEVRRAFAATAIPELSRSLLRRPPRLPANVKVPKAKVVNVVPGPSHGGIYSVSVSLLRVGVTSELRLDMERLKSDGWRVTNVLG
jgi:hypothetical protein